MDFDALVAKLQVRWPAVKAPAVQNGERVVLIPADQNLAILAYLKNDPELSFDSLMSLVGVDSGRELWVVYPLHSFKHLHRLLVKAILPRINPGIDSVCSLWNMADFFEREAYDLYGITFHAHPDLRRILNPQDWEGWPGRKDYEYPMEYQGIPTVRADQFFDDAISKGVEEREAEDKAIAVQIEAEMKAKLTEKK